MKLTIKNIENGQSIPFEDSYDLSDMEFFGERPMVAPVVFTGCVSRRAGLAVLNGEISACLHLRCDRCGVSFQRQKTVPVSVTLALSLQDEERDDIVLCPGGVCDLEPIAVSEWVLQMDYQNLCSPDCAGLCPVCGGNRNLDPCVCEPL